MPYVHVDREGNPVEQGGTAATSIWVTTSEVSTITPLGMRSCTGCNRTLPLTREAFRWQPTISRFHTRCRECERSARRTPRPSRNATRAAQNLTSRFGVELEVICRAGTGAVQRALSDAGLTGWRATYDGSLTSGGVEVVSPILRGEDGMNQIRRVCGVLSNLGATVNSSCGMHVHLDVNGLSVDTVKRFLAGYVDNQHVMDGLVAGSRRSNTYCRPWGETEKRRALNATTVREMANHQGGRYRTVNPRDQAASGHDQFPQGRVMGEHVHGDPEEGHDHHDPRVQQREGSPRHHRGRRGHERLHDGAGCTVRRRPRSLRGER
jgi:hypothetical protein